MDKRYQVFISSTYADLEAERRAVIQTVIELDCIPAGMELFPAADEDQFEFIKRVIDDCDYYLLIIGGRYGSTTADELPGLVALSLSKTIKMFPAEGWVRANRQASEDVLGEVNELRKENDLLKRAVLAMTPADRPPVDDIAGLDDSFTLTGEYTPYRPSGSRRYSWSVDASWRDIFAAIGPYLYEYPNDTYVKSVLTEAMFERYSDGGSSPSLKDQVFKTVTVQLRALGLVKTEYMKTTGDGMALFWSLTPAGEGEMLKSRIVRKTPDGTE